MNKQLVIEHLFRLLDEKIILLKSNLLTLTEVRDNETKCTVGDKYETGRAMAQMELEKCQYQLTKTEDLKTILKRIDSTTTSEFVAFGSLIETTENNYFISIAFGRINVQDESVMCISPVSPIGKILMGKSVGELVNFQNKKIKIRTVQ
jgi:transcription elongation GreA/GreB family factor